MNTKVQWFEQIAANYQAGISHAFILHFNVKDNVTPHNTDSPAKYIASRLASRKIIITYSLDRGIEFATKTGKELAKKILGIQEQPNTPDPALEALMAAGAISPDQNEFPTAPGQAFPILDTLLRSKKEDNLITIIIEDADMIIPDSPIQMLAPEDRAVLAIISRWGNDRELMAIGNPTFIITQDLSAIHSKLRTASARFEAIEIPLPDETTREILIKTQVKESSKLSIDTPTIKKLAKQTAALGLLHVEDILLRVKMTGTLTPEIVTERKNTIIRTEFGDVIEFMESETQLKDVGGLSHVKRFFQNSIIKPIAEGKKYRVPMGVLLLGPAGTGKTMIAQAVANEAGMNAVYLRVGGQIASKWQGEGERNLARALRAIESLAPAIVFIDEIDQVVSRGGDGGNQQNDRIFQRLLEFMGDDSHRGEIIFLAASNRPDRIDAALKRPGRFDKKIPFLVPNEADRYLILKVLIEQTFDYKITGLDREGILEVTEGWTGAELQASTIKAAELLEDEPETFDVEQTLGELGIVSEATINAALIEAISRLSPSTASIEQMTRLAIAECNDKDLLPPEYRDLLDNTRADPKPTEQIKRTQRKRAL